MIATSGTPQFRALYTFVFVLVVFLAIAAIIPLVQFRGEIVALAKEDAVRDLGMLASHMHEAILRHDYTAASESVALWGRENDRVVNFRAVAPNGFVFSEYNREPSAENAHTLRVSREIRQDGRLLATLHLAEDLTAFEYEAEKLIYRNIAAFTVFTLVLGSVLWLTLRRAAILPLQQLVAQVQDLNLTLEERVRSRTEDLVRTNEDLEGEIGERIKVEEQLKESEERYRSIVANAADGVFLLDISGPGGPVIAEANESACRMHGYSHEELIGMPIAALDDAASRKKIKERVDALRDGQTLRFEVTHFRKDKTPLPLEVSAQLITVQGKPFVITVERDITQRKKAEDVLQRAKASLERQNEELKKIDKMKDALIRDVSHELKTPVAKHAMQLEILRPLLEGGALSEGDRRAFAVMEQSILRQTSVITNLLNLSRLEAGGRTYRREDVQLDKLVRKVLADYGESIAALGIAVSVDMAEITLKSDKEMLWHVFSNLFSNAIKYQRVDNSPAIAISAWFEKADTVVRIEDNGIGMSREVQASVFTRFYQASPSAEGSGVGLTICRRIVEDLGGSIHLESPGIDRGTVVEIKLPRA